MLTVMSNFILYGTMINKLYKEEAADLYIFRKAETKAVGIGQISRILKKNAVDCIQCVISYTSIDNQVNQIFDYFTIIICCICDSFHFYLYFY